MSSAESVRPRRTRTLPLVVDAFIGPPLVVASTFPFVVCASTSAVAPSTVTPPFTVRTSTFTPFGTRTWISTEMSLSRLPSPREEYRCSSHDDRSFHSAQMRTFSSPAPYFCTSNRTHDGSARRQYLVAVTSTRSLVDGSTNTRPLRFCTRIHLPGAMRPDQLKASCSTCCRCAPSAAAVAATAISEKQIPRAACPEERKRRRARDD